MHKLLLIILDGFGYRAESEGNAIARAKMPFYDSLLQNHPHTLLHASSEHVGLPKDTMGNSEVGHLNIGAGRVVEQDCVRINSAISEGTFFENSELLTLFDNAGKRGRSVHLVGLLSDASVHAQIDHLIALVGLARNRQVKTRLHLFTDGRDMDPHSAKRLIDHLEPHLGGDIQIATIGGRYFGMDRDKRWKRTKKAYDAIVAAQGEDSESAMHAIDAAYERGESDEFIRPTVIGDYAGIEDGDSVFSFNFRADRARQLCWAFQKENFEHFECTDKNVELATMTLYDKKGLVCPVAFSEQTAPDGIAETLSRQKKSQIHIAESEKYAHVTYFFNGGVEEPFEGEERTVVPSQSVDTYDLAPQMSAAQITDTALDALSKDFDFILVNYANADMVGHTGNVDATVRALEVLDAQLRRLVESAKDYVVAITADHGNCEDMTEAAKTSHTTAKVPFIIISDQKFSLKEGALCNVAPTLFDLCGIETSKAMTAQSLLDRNS